MISSLDREAISSSTIFPFLANNSNIESSRHTVCNSLNIGQRKFGYKPANGSALS